MATKKKDENDVKDIVVKLNLRKVTVPIVGTNQLIVSRFDEKCKQEIAEAAPGKLKQGKGKKAVDSPEDQYKRSIYYLSDGKRYGFPAVAFKAAMVRAGKELYDMPMMRTKMLIRVIADDPETGYVEIHGKPEMREDMVRVGGINKVACPRYRAAFPVWSANLTIEYLEDAISEEQIVGLVGAAGFCCGIGEWRPEKANSGSFGTWTVNR